jgi:serine/threonine-protein kinase RsbW
MMPSSAPRGRSAAEPHAAQSVAPAPGSGVQARPQSHPLSASLRLSGLRAPGEARAYVGLTLADWGVAESVRADMKLIVSELTTNAVTYTCSPQITVEITLTDDEAAVSVGDHGPHRQLHAQRPAPDAEHGRGLLLVDALASRWEQSKADDGGTIVRAGIDLPGRQPLSTAQTSEDGPDVPRDHP